VRGRILLSVLILFHCVVLVWAPYRAAHSQTTATVALDAYARPLSMVVAWSFFAPEPGPPPIYVEWELLDSADSTLKRGRWPESADGYFFRERQNKRTQIGRFLSQADTHAEGLLLPYLCKTHLGTHSVKLWRVQESLPRMEEVRSGQRKAGDGLGVDRRYVSHSFCPHQSLQEAKK
jgi:hypothetical protein